jgi:hypothetical protein
MAAMYWIHLFIASTKSKTRRLIKDAFSLREAFDSPDAGRELQLLLAGDEELSPLCGLYCIRHRYAETIVKE